MTSRSRSWSVDVFGLAAVAGAFHDLAAESVDLVGGHFAEVVVEGVAGFDLLAVDQKRAGRGNGLPCSSKFRNSSRRPFTRFSVPSSFLRMKPEM